MLCNADAIGCMRACFARCRYICQVWFICKKLLGFRCTSMKTFEAKVYHISDGRNARLCSLCASWNILLALLTITLRAAARPRHLLGIPGRLRCRAFCPDTGRTLERDDMKSWKRPELDSLGVYGVRIADQDRNLMTSFSLLLTQTQDDHVVRAGASCCNAQDRAAFVYRTIRQKQQQRQRPLKKRPMASRHLSGLVGSVATNSCSCQADLTLTICRSHMTCNACIAVGGATLRQRPEF